MIHLLLEMFSLEPEKADNQNPCSNFITSFKYASHYLLTQIKSLVVSFAPNCTTFYSKEANKHKSILGLA